MIDTGPRVGTGGDRGVVDQQPKSPISLSQLASVVLKEKHYVQRKTYNWPEAHNTIVVNR